jgi:hypothetical protein
MAETPSDCHEPTAFTPCGVKASSVGTALSDETLAAVNKSIAVHAIAKYREWQIAEELKAQSREPIDDARRQQIADELKALSLELLEATLAGLPEWAKPVDVKYMTTTVVEFKLRNAPPS